ncbi:hypothetical protein D3C73_185770 [compost metagenome]
MPLPHKEAFLLTEEEYWETNKEFESEDQDLPSTFLSEEDLPGDTNVLIIPNYKINLDLILDGYVEMLTRSKTKVDLRDVLERIWFHAEKHGALTERLDKLQMDVEMLKFDLMMDAGCDPEFIDDEEDI